MVRQQNFLKYFVLIFPDNFVVHIFLFLKNTPFLGQTNCIDETDGSEHGMDSTWTNSQCYKCHCSSTGMTCCDTIVPPSNPNPTTCTVVYDYQTCQANLVSRDDPSLPC
uniref:Beta-microseminoprotein n=1 Tax=Pygocentrus nattereri TaxID=42514 RepID=A0A3B4CTX0_PYGNA